MEKIKVLFVCLGNICRSPMAEGVFTHLVEQAGLADRFEIDSAGTSGWHAGELADARMRSTARSKGIELISRSRQIVTADFQKFDYIIPMDRSNDREIQALARHARHAGANIIMMRDFDPVPEDGNVPDPYYGGDQGFENVYDILLRSNQKFLDFLKENHDL